MLRKPTLDEIAAQCRKNTPPRILEQIAELRGIAAEAVDKVDREGTVVRTLKGDVIAHPAIRVHAEASKAEAALLKEWAPRSMI